MSVRATSWAWDLGLAGIVKGGELLTLLRVADHADNDGVCWPGEKSLAEFTSQGERTVRRHLVDLGRTVAGRPPLLHRARVFREEGRGRSYDGIFLHLDQPAKSAGRKSRDQPATKSTSTGQIEQDQPASGDTALYKEPSRNRQEPSCEGEIFVFSLGLIAPLEQVAEAKQAVLDRAALDRALNTYPDRDQIEEAEKFADWHLHGRGQNARLISVAAAFRNWLKRAAPAEPGQRRHLAAVAPRSDVREFHGDVDLNAEWPYLLNRLFDSTEASTFRLWFQMLDPVGVNAGTVLVGTTRGKQAWTERRFSAMVSEALADCGREWKRAQFTTLPEVEGRAAA